MTNRFVNPIIKYTTSTLKTMPGAELYFYVTGTATPKVTYQDFNGTIPHANPVVALSDGHFPPIFLDGTYRAELKYLGITQPGWPVDDIGATNDPAPLADWNSGFSYSNGDLVTGPDGNRYESLQNNNLNNDPTAPGSLYWSQIFLSGNVDSWQQLDIAARSGSGPKADAESAIRYSLDLPEPTAISYVKGAADGTYSNRTLAQVKTDLDISTVTSAAFDNKVTGPASASDGVVALFNGITGKLIKAGDTIANYLEAFLITLYNIFPKRIDTWASISSVTPVGAGQIFDLAQHTSNGIGAGKMMAFSGSVTDDGGTQKNAAGGFYLKRISFDQYTAQFWNNDLTVALPNCPNGDIYLENMVYGPVNISLTRNNLNIIGAGMPQMSATLDRLENGTVIRGTLLIGGNNCTLRDLGVDRGNYVTDTLLAGVADNALVVHDPALASLKKGNKLQNVYGLIKNSVAFHAVLYEFQADGDLRNVHGRGGEWGVVLKAQNTTFDGLHSYNNIQGGVVLKSDSYAPCSGITGTNVVCREGGTAGNGFYIYAASLQTQNIVVSNIYTDGYSEGVKIVCSPRSPYTYPANDIVLANINIRNANTFGLETYGALVGFAIDNVNISDTVSGKAFKLDDNCLGATIGKITVSAPSGIGTIPADSVYLAGRFTVGSVQSTKGYDLASLGGVTIVPDANRLWNVSKIIGRCNLTRISGSGYTLPNGWTGAFGSVPRSTYQNGRCIMSGRLAVPSTPWTGKEVCFNVGANMAPTQDLFRVVGGYDATNIKFVPIFVTVKTNGDIEVTQLNTTSSFPTTISFIELDGLEWDVSNLST